MWIEEHAGLRFHAQVACHDHFGQLLWLWREEMGHGGTYGNVMKSSWLQRAPSGDTIALIPSSGLVALDAHGTLIWSTMFE